MMNAFFTLLLWAWLMASSFVVSGHMVNYASPIATTGFRFLLALIMMLLVLLVSWYQAKRPIRQEFKALFDSPRHALHYLLISGSLVGFFIGLFMALETTTPLNTSVLYTLIPLMGVIITKIWLHISTPWIKVGGFMMGSIGATGVLFSTQVHSLQDLQSFQWNQGDLLYIGACVLLAFHVVSVQKWGSRLKPFPGAFMIMLFGSMWLLPITLIWGELDQVQWGTSGFWVNALYLTIFTTLFTFVLQQRLVSTVGANRLLAFSYTIPVWVAFYTAFAESSLSTLLNIGFVLGVVCLGTSLYLISRQRIHINGSSVNKVNLASPHTRNGMAGIVTDEAK